MYSPRKKYSSQERLKTIPNFKDYVRELPLGLPDEIMNSIKKIPTLTHHFVYHLDMVKLYRPSLGSNVYSCWVDMLYFIKKIVGQINTVVVNTKNEYEAKIENIVRATKYLEKNNTTLKERLEKIEMLRDIESQDLSLAEIETQTLKKYLNSIYEIMHKDIQKILDYLVNIEKSQDSETSSSIFVGLERLASSIKMLYDYRNITSNTLGTMNELIKAMAKNTKADSCTQVEESELQWKTTDVFPTERNKKMSLDEVYRSSMNMESKLDKSPDKHIITLMQIKEKYLPPEIYNPKKNIERPWTLPPTILAFLENMSKENENGRVLPWEYVKRLIYEIYQERVAFSRELLGGMIGNVCSFDEFFVLYFIRKYNIRRLAELKMLELIISIKYYSKFWPKAEMFAYMLDIMRFQPSFYLNETNAYKFDLYTQNFFLSVFSKMHDGEVVEWEDGATYASFNRIKNIMRKFLFFTDDLTRSRLFSKLEKSIRQKDKKYYADYDFAMQLFMDEYFSSRKKHQNIISKAFSKTSETINGYFSLKEVTTVFKELYPVFAQGSGFGQKYPTYSSIQLSKLYLYSITGAKNSFYINGKYFLAACQRYGFDCPFPFIHICGNADMTFKEKSQELEPIKSINSVEMSKTIREQQSVELKETVKEETAEQQQINSLSMKRIEIGSIIFSQHFSILRYLRYYCLVFKETMSGEKDINKLWNDFDKILHILEKGCQFLRYPLKS